MNLFQTSFRDNYLCHAFFVTSLYVPSGLHTGTKTWGKSFLACCSVYFFSATHLDVSEEHHKSSQSLHITDSHDSTHSSTVFLWCANTKPTHSKSQWKMLNIMDYEEWKQNAEGDGGETIQDISEAADTCVAGNRTNTPGLIRSTSGRPGGKAITERGSLCCSCRTFQAPKKRADAQGKPDPSLMSLGLPLSPPKPRRLLSSAWTILGVFVDINVGQQLFTCVHLKSFHICPTETWIILSLHSCFISSD